LSSKGLAQGVLAPEDDLKTTVQAFLETWLVQRDVEGAKRYLAYKPILGECMIPDEYANKKLKSSQVTAILDRVMKAVLERTPNANSLSEILDSSEGVPLEDTNVTFIKHPMQNYYQLFALKSREQPQLAYICKFDTRQSFRTKVNNPKAFYLSTKIRGIEGCKDLNLEFVWAKENNRWRIITIAGADE
jgi:hypothetical protein